MPNPFIALQIQTSYAFQSLLFFASLLLLIKYVINSKINATDLDCHLAFKDSLLLRNNEKLDLRRLDELADQLYNDSDQSDHRGYELDKSFAHSF